ncbi:MAG: THUMP domain-containing protein [Burkholderiaceae bacterium]|nr:THUMP domain-containing protein [Burkholderiaceae bacterium]
MFELFAACPRGLEAALVAELEALGAADCRALGGGVLFSGSRAVAYSVNLWSRLASRVMRSIGRRRYRDDDDLYRLANSVAWEQHFDAQRTLRVDVSAQRSPLRSLNFATLRIKDGIVDRLRTASGARPSIDTRSPDVRVFAHLEAREATLYLDLSGEPLFKRGWRSGADDKGSAALKENLAAGLLALAGWAPGTPLCDPFCGSGTIAIEAAQRAFDIAPGATRSFGFERLLDHDAPLWKQLRDEATQRARSAARRVAEAGAVRIAGSDLDRDAIARARRNLVRAGVPDRAVAWRTLDAGRVRAPFDDPGLVVTNPPYGERLQARSAGAPHGSVRHDEAMRAFGVSLKEQFGGWQVWILSSDPQLPRQLGMQERRRTPLYNGAIECRLFSFEVFGPREVPPTPGRPSPR